ncbi:breast cancer type 2 susceptibility protein [Eucyclogobius newberryi]|uniref:breast cancer type 2 susceptibility protein n=1 Tax=Eucyclogobius newberryi TaxID=166745 RepID=UPI003B59A868
MYNVFRDQIWKDLGQLDPDWFEALTAEAFEEGDVSYKDELCANQEELFAHQEELREELHTNQEALCVHQEELREELHTNQEELCAHWEDVSANKEVSLLKSPKVNRGRFYSISSTPRVFRLYQTLSPEADQSAFSTKQDGDRHCSSIQTKSSYARGLSERLGAQMENISWSSSLNTPPPMPSTWILTRKESESTFTLSGDTSIFARKLFHYNRSASTDGLVPVSPVIPDDAEVTGNDKMVPNSSCNTVESCLCGTENAINSSSIQRKVRNERIHMRLITSTKEKGCDAVEPSPIRNPSDKSTESRLKIPALTQWSPISLSELQTEFFSPSACLNALKQVKLRKRQGSVNQNGENISGKDPALTLKPNSADDGGFSNTTIPVLDLENKITSDSVSFKTASNQIRQISPAKLTKSQHLNNTEETLNDIPTFADAPQRNTDIKKNTNEDWNLTVSQKAEVKDLCEFLEESASQFDFTQTAGHNIFEAIQNKSCPTLKSEALPSSSPSKIQTWNQSNKAENGKRAIFGEAETAMEMKGQTVRNSFEGGKANTSFTQGFKMASGKGIAVSDKNLQKYKELFKDLAQDVDGVSFFGKTCFMNSKLLDKNEKKSSLLSLDSGLKRAQDDRHSISAIKKAKICEEEANMSVDTEESSCNIVRSGTLSEPVDSDHPIHPQESGTTNTNEICPGPKTIEQPNFNCGQSKQRHVSLTNESSGFPMNNTVKLTTKNTFENNKPRQTDMANVENLKCGFRTARGTQVQLSKKYIDKVRHLWNDFDNCVNPPNEFITAHCGDLNEASNLNSVLSDGNGVSSGHKMNTPKAECSTQIPHTASAMSRQNCVFQTVAGAKVNISSDAPIECENSQSKVPLMKGNGSVPPTSGFLAASGKALSVSAEALLKAKVLFDFIDSTSNIKEPSEILKTDILIKSTKKYLPEKIESLSYHKNSRACSQLSTDCSSETAASYMSSNYCASSRNGFTTASGRKVRVSEEALNKAMSLLSEGTESENRFQDMAQRKGSTNNKCVKPLFTEANSKSATPHIASSDEPGLTCEHVKSSNAEIGSPTAVERNVQTKNNKERALEHPIDIFDATLASNTGSGFTTASGKKVGVSQEALNKAMKMLSSDIELDGDDKSCKAEVIRGETLKLQPGFVKSTYAIGADKRIDSFTSNLNPPVRINLTSDEKTHPPVTKEGSVPPVVVNLDALQLHGCSSMQQQILAQEALDCTRALLEDEVRAAQHLAVSLKCATSLSGKPPQKKEDGTDERVLKRSSSPGELDRACDEPKKPVSDPAWSSRSGLLKDRRLFKYHVLRHPNTPRPHGCLKEQVKSNPMPSTPAKRGAAKPERPAFVPPFLNTKLKVPENVTQKDKEKTCTFVPPFKKHKSDVHGNFTKLTKDSSCVKESSTTHTFLPPTPKRPYPWNDNTSKQGNDPDVGEEKAPECEVFKNGAIEKPIRVIHIPETEPEDVMEAPDHVFAETLGSMGDLARDLQDMRIRKKRQQSIKVLPGSVFLTKTSQVKRLSFRAMVNSGTPQKYSHKQLYQFGVHHEVCHITSQTAESFCFNLLKFHKLQSLLEAGGVQLADGGWLVPRVDGTVGKEEFYKALCDTPGVDPKLISPQWVFNHYRWIVWKLASMERTFPACMGSVCLTPEQVLLQLKYRYDAEVDHSRRSSLKKIMEKDDTSAKTIVLCMCGFFSDGQHSPGPAQDACVRPESPCAIVWLTDGWYCIKTQLDAPLTAMLHRGYIVEGMKLIVHGAQLVGSGEACTPLEAPDSLLLKISANSTRRTRWDTKLGFYKDPRPFVLPLYSLFSKGGLAGCVDMVILRIYPTQWMERKPDGGVVFRSGRSEEKEARRFNIHKKKHLEAMYAKIKAQFEKEDRERLKSKTMIRSVRHEELDRFQDGEELYEAVGEELSDVEAYLSEEQLQTLYSYKCSVLEKRQAELQGRLHRAVEEAESSEGSFPCRDVSPVWRMTIMDYLDQTSSCVYQLSVWSPPAELQALLKEGCRYRTYNLTASEGRTGGCRATVQLTATRKTLFTRLQASSHWLLGHFRPRASVSFAELQNPGFFPLCGEVDLTGCVISITDQYGSSPVIYLVDEALNVVKVHACVSLARCGWEDVMQLHALVSMSNLQVRGQCVSAPTVLPVLYTGDMTELSKNPRESHLQQGLSRLRQAFQDQEDFFLRAEQRLIEILTCEGQSFSAVDPKTPRRTGTTDLDLCAPRSTKITSDTVENRTAPTPIFKTPAQSNCSTKKDPRSLKTRRALDQLCQYAPPPPLSPLSTIASSSVNKTFCPPRRSQPPVTTGSADLAPVEEGWVHDEELALIDTQDLQAADSPMD